MEAVPKGGEAAQAYSAGHGNVREQCMDSGKEEKGQAASQAQPNLNAMLAAMLSMQKQMQEMMMQMAASAAQSGKQQGEHERANGSAGENETPRVRRRLHMGSSEKRPKGGSRG